MGYKRRSNVLLEYGRIKCYFRTGYGALSGGKIIGIGRRKSYLISCCIGIIGSALTVFQNVYALLIGRLILGLACGVMSVVLNRYIEETVPAHMLGKYGAFFAFSGTVGSTTALLLGLALPNDD